MAFFTRETDAPGFTNKGSALTWAQGDDNLIGLYDLAISGITSGGDTYWSGGTGTNAVALIGNLGIASGNYSVSEGYATTSSGNQSHAEGSGSIASATGSHAEGKNTQATGNFTHAEGQATVAGPGIRAHAEGYGTTASGQDSHAEGANTTASGDYSHSEGASTTALGGYSHAEGQDTLAGGQSSHAEGADTRALGSGSHAEGEHTTAAGDHSHAGGRASASDPPDFNIIASGNTSFVHFNGEGAGVIPGLGAYGDYSAILGGRLHNIGYNASSSGIFVGSANTINTSVERSAIIGGEGITASASDTVYVTNLSVNGDATITGHLAATTKSFEIDHPTQEGKRLIYGALEGPEHAVFVRGELKDNNIINLPEHWSGLVHEESITVQLTAIGKPCIHYVEEIKDYNVFVGCEDGLPHCYYLIHGERKDVGKLEIEK